MPTLDGKPPEAWPAGISRIQQRGNWLPQAHTHNVLPASALTVVKVLFQLMGNLWRMRPIKHLVAFALCRGADDVSGRAGPEYSTTRIFVRWVGIQFSIFGILILFFLRCVDRFMTNSCTE